MSLNLPRFPLLRIAEVPRAVFRFGTVGLTAVGDRYERVGASKHQRGNGTTSDSRLDSPATTIIALLRVAALSAGILGSLAGCPPHDPPEQSADAVVYAQAYCQDLCAKFDECSPVPESFDECLVDECVESYLGNEADPCLSFNVESVRCRIERETCEEFFDLHIDTTPNSICYDVVEPLLRCAVEHQDDS